MTARVLIADDHPPTRAVVRATLESAGFEVCAETNNGTDAVALAVKHRPDICLLDIRMPGNGISAAARISEQVPGASIVMLTVSRNDDDLLDALKAGAKGYLLKDIDQSRSPEALQAVLDGEAALGGALVARLIDEFRRRSERRVRTAKGEVELSQREWEVLELLRKGRSTAQIGRELFVAPVTVRSHVASILRKLHVGSREEMLQIFARD